ncbi:DUF5069 domain-containing protein [Luteolibacter pohnpeiensis]|uniref:DUF5069 domain-containing protein n=1 Tax=Luteolibacter pohnpeiensis TaxID=454153 RepID=A0A934VYI5_9BACT|nr:DUF5069 domain-containing protein [Luteolibacter pohnpeiensis]MBK1884554.1 DUF5069 domain-containing protein [Luteolibacter pohnpeiensis]
MTNPHPTIIPGLRSPYELVGMVVHFGRMLDKIRLNAEGKLPAEWVAAKGIENPRSFDSRCCNFLKIDYAELETETLKGRTDSEMLEWAFLHGRRPSEDEIQIWNAFMMKLGWRDPIKERVTIRLAEIGMPPGTVETMFDFIDLDEGRALRY